MNTATFSHESMPARPWYRHRWPWLLMLGPATVVAAGTYTIVLAVSRPDALVVDDYYKQGKAINQDLSRDRKAAAMGMKAHIHYDAAKGLLQGELASRQGAVTGPVSIKLVHSTLPGKDVRLLAQPDGQGRFSVSLPMLDLARWQVVVEDGAHGWRLNGVWQWPQDRELRLEAGEPSAG